MFTHFRNATFYTLMKGNSDVVRTNINVLKSCFLYYVKSESGASASPVNLLKMQNLRFYPRPTESESVV